MLPTARAKHTVKMYEIPLIAGAAAEKLNQLFFFFF